MERNTELGGHIKLKHDGVNKNSIPIKRKYATRLKIRSRQCS